MPVTRWIASLLCAVAVLSAAIAVGAQAPAFDVASVKASNPNPTGGPLAVAELVDSTRRALQELLDQALPPRWMFG